MEAIRAYKGIVLLTRTLSNRTAGMASLTGASGADAVMDPSQEDEFRTLMSTVYTNLATAYLKMDDAEKALQYSDKALREDPTELNVKALLRQAQALRVLGRAEEARSVLAAALGAHKANDGLRSSLKEELALLVDASAPRGGGSGAAASAGAGAAAGAGGAGATPAGPR
jgi:tetratricopeptide (TPR) repeat protein